MKDPKPQERPVRVTGVADKVDVIGLNLLRVELVTPPKLAQPVVFEMAAAEKLASLLMAASGQVQTILASGIAPAEGPRSASTPQLARAMRVSIHKPTRTATLHFKTHEEEDLQINLPLPALAALSRQIQAALSSTRAKPATPEAKPAPKPRRH